MHLMFEEMTFGLKKICVLLAFFSFTTALQSTDCTAAVLSGNFTSKYEHYQMATKDPR